MDLTHFSYDLPQDLIAQYPLKRREKARLMVIDRASGKISHDIFAHIGRYLPARSLLVVNDSKVLPVRLLGKRKTGGQVEIFLLKKLDQEGSFQTLIRPLGRLNLGEEIMFEKTSLTATLLDAQKRIVRFNRKDVIKYLNRVGHMPLPPYIKRADEALDRRYYQTVFAKHNGSVASPTAGLHFTKPLLSQLKKSGHDLKKVTLHINYATFNPVKELDITKHQMHFEDYSVSKKTWDEIRKAKAEGRKIVPVGTTSCRVLESMAAGKSLKGSTNLFIYPGYRFKMVDVLITNFHLPQSTLLMLVYAFGSTELMQQVYRQAIKEKYRFYSYGDGMMIL